MRRLVFVLLLISSPLFAKTRIVLLHFSDYHSHAVPFFSEGRADQGGIARAIGYMERARKSGAVVVSGGDMVNKGSPAWSDKFTCAEWSWLNGIVDAMALGNHDVDYGTEWLRDCRSHVAYPILSGNTERFPAKAIVKRGGVKIGVFAIASDDFHTLTKGLTFADRVAAARAAVAELRSVCDAVVMIGHERIDEDEALAREVPGIDVIFATHSHVKENFRRIAGTSTYFISPFQYLTYISRVELTIDQHRVVGATGKLVRVDSSIKADSKVAARVAKMERELEADPQYAPFFQPVGTLAHSLPVRDLGMRTVELMRDAVHADVAISTTSSFRQDLPSGVIAFETLRQAMPYDNEIVVATMAGEQLQRVLDFNGDPSYATAVSVDRAKTYRVATTDYLAKVSAYKQFFADVEKSGLRARDQVRRWIAAK
jgi:5'-nucleotidase/UDP-sugar diphosphatase